MAINHETTNHEGTRLLDSHEQTATTASHHLVPQTHSPRKIVILVTVMIVFLMFGDWLLIVPSTRIYEDIICHHYYDGLDDQTRVALNEKIDEKQCKLDPIQAELAIVMAGINVSKAVPGILFAFPYGLLADRYGRKLVFILSIVGVLLTQFWMVLVCWFWQIFPLRLIWLSPIFMAIGGGETVAQSMVFALISDVSTDATRAYNFFIAIFGSLISEMAAPSVASKLMEKDPWIPLLIGLAIFSASTLFLFFIPETLHLRPHDGTVEPITPDSNSEEDLAEGGEAESRGKDLFTSLKAQLREQLSNLYYATEIFHDVRLVLLIATFMLQPLNRQVVDLSIRYISKRFDWTLAETGFLLSFRAAVNIILFAIILPGLSYVFTAPRTAKPSEDEGKFKIRGLGISNRGKDLTLARLSMLCLTLGSLLIGIPSIGVVISGLMINVLGTGFATLTRSLLTLLVDQQHVARVYAALAVVEQVGAVAAGPFLALLYNSGLKWKGAWVGLPFFGMALLDVLAGGGVWAVKLPAEGEGEAREETAEEEAAEARDEVEHPLLGTVN